MAASRPGRALGPHHMSHSILSVRQVDKGEYGSAAREGCVGVPRQLMMPLPLGMEPSQTAGLEPSKKVRALVTVVDGRWM